MKKATFYALISASVIFLSQVVTLILFTLENLGVNRPWGRIIGEIRMWENDNGFIWVCISNVAVTIGWASLIIFFATLFRNQRKKKVILFVLVGTSLNLLNSFFTLFFVPIFIPSAQIILWVSLIIFFLIWYKPQRTKKVILFALVGSSSAFLFNRYRIMSSDWQSLTVGISIPA